ESRRERLEGPQLLHCVAWDDLQVDFAGALTVISGCRDGQAVERDGDEIRMGPSDRRELTNVIVVDGGHAGDTAEGFGNGNVGERADLIARQGVENGCRLAARRDLCLVLQDRPGHDDLIRLAERLGSTVCGLSESRRTL